MQQTSLCTISKRQTTSVRWAEDIICMDFAYVWEKFCLWRKMQSCFWSGWAFVWWSGER